MGVVRSMSSKLLLEHSSPLVILFLTQINRHAFGSSLYLPEKKVELKFEDFDLERSYSSCKQPTNANVYVQIRDGQDQESRELVPHCRYYASSGPPDVYSSGRYMWVKFYSNSQNSFKGFKAHFEAVDLRKYRYY